jgi:hypothetical protein
MKIFAVMLANRYGETIPPFIRQPMAVVFFMIAVVAVVSLIVNRKKLDEIDEPPKVVGKPWKCPKCGEQSEPQFDSCWKCGTVRKQDSN